MHQESHLLAGTIREPKHHYRIAKEVLVEVQQLEGAATAKLGPCAEVPRGAINNGMVDITPNEDSAVIELDVLEDNKRPEVALVAGNTVAREQWFDEQQDVKWGEKEKKGEGWGDGIGEISISIVATDDDMIISK